MSVSSDSIQTLLKQRRELRGYLQELRDEISALNLRAEKLVPDKVGDVGAELQMVNAETAGEPAPQSTGAPQVTRPKPSAPVLPTANILASENDMDARAEGEEPKDKKLEPEDKMSDPPAIDPKIDETEDFTNLESESLLYRAKLLSDYFLNHPAPVTGQALSDLDTAVRRSEKAETAVELEKDIVQLRNAYRVVASTSYQETGVNGETLADSRADISILWIVPLYIAGLTLVVFPLLLLGRSLATRMFVSDFSNEVSFVMTGIVTFLWGAVGALSYLAWGVARSAKTNTYRSNSNRDIGLKATLGGVLGLAVFLSLVRWIPIEGILPDMAIGLLAFFVGLVSSILYALLYRIISKATGKVEKKG